MEIKKSVYDMTDRELRIYKRKLRRQREIRRRCMSFVMTLGLIAICAVSYHSLKTSANSGTDSINFKYYTNVNVAYGETLWDIADEYIDYKEYKDKNEYIAEVKSINHLDDEANVKAGQFLVVPYFSTEFVQ